MDQQPFFLKPISGDTQSLFTHTNHTNNQEFTFDHKGIAFITDHTLFSASVRKSIENFKNHFKNITIYDAGIADNLQSSQLTTLFRHLNQKKIVPFILGIDLESLADVSIALNSQIFQLSNKISNITSDKKLIHNNFIGYQRHLCELEDIYEIENNYYNAASLGKIRTYPYLVEPVIRDCQLLHVSLDAIKSSECPGIPGSLPTGLNAEELCQLMKYVGTANNLKAVCINTYDITQNTDAASLIAEALWYFAEGMNLQQNHDHPAINPDSSSFIVTNSSLDDDLLFYKNNITHRWWVKKSIDNTASYLPCAYEEYENCVNNDIPDRIYKFMHS